MATRVQRCSCSDNTNIYCSNTPSYISSIQPSNLNPVDRSAVITADPVQTCHCSPYAHICCCGPLNGITLIQPACQNLPDGSVVNNPTYVPGITASFWTYKFITDCSKTTRAISNFGIPICETIAAANVTVFEKVDGCGHFVSVPFILIRDDPNLGLAPTGFQWLKVETGGRYDKGVCSEYRIQLTGDYATDIQPIKVKAANNIITFDCGCFLVPKCNSQGKLAIAKSCAHPIVNNQVTYTGQVNIINIGNASLDNVQFLDVIFIASTLGLGPLIVNPSTLTVDKSVPGQIKISGSLGAINPGATITVTYSFPITSIPATGKYITNNTATATATGTQAAANCSTNLDVVQVSTTKCCSIKNTNSGSFTFTIASVGDSPSTAVNVRDYIIIPAGITLQFTGLGGCTATFTSGGGTVPLNTNIAGPVDITIACDNLSIPAGGAVARTVNFRIESSTVWGMAAVHNSLGSIVLSNPDTQVFLGAGQLPAEAEIDVRLNLICRQICI